MKVTDWGRVSYTSTYNAMQRFTAERTTDSEDELWLCEHLPIFTQGLAGLSEHILSPGDIPVVATNRGGQVTFHGPGQLVAYPLINLQKRGYFIKEYVYRLEESVIRTLRDFGVTGHRVSGAPGIYVRLDDPRDHRMLPQRPQQKIDEVHSATPFDGLGKIAALGIKVSRHCAYHGLSLNVAMDLSAFARINPCGYAGLKTVDFSTIGVDVSPDEVKPRLSVHLQSMLAA